MATAFKQVVHQNLECPVCLGFFKDPKILTCSHTFCKGCLETFLETQIDEQKLSCPVCREESSVPDGDVSRLQPNIALRSLVEDVETQTQVCVNCDSTLAVAYCNDCGDYLCEFCKDAHSKWSRYKGHSVLAASDVLSGKILLRRRCKCPKHPTDDEECFCVGCRKYVCFKCGVLEHSKDGHELVEALLHEKEQKEVIEELTSKAESKLKDIDKYITFVIDQREGLQNVRTRLHHEIDESYEEKVRKLTESKMKLKSDVDKHLKDLETSLEEMEVTGRQQIARVNALSELVKNGLKIPLQKEALTTHNTLCQEIKELLDRVDHDEQKPRKTAAEGERIHFMKSSRIDGLELGEVRMIELKWILRAEKPLPTDGMEGMANSPDGVMAVCCYQGGIWKYSSEGLLLETVLKPVKVRALDCMSDGTYVVRNSDNQLSLYTQQCEEIDVTFGTLGDTEGGYGNLTTDQDGNILTGYWNTTTIQVFTPEGGKAIREIECNGFIPHQIFAMNQCKALIVKSDDTVRVIDGLSGAGVTNHSVTKEGMYAYPAVCKDDSILIAWVSGDQSLININHYTTDLKHIKNIITDFKIKKPSRNWYFIQQFKTGEIAFCTPDKLYIFCETLEK